MQIIRIIFAIIGYGASYYYYRKAIKSESKQKTIRSIIQTILLLLIGAINTVSFVEVIICA